jgi:hypothetical protein
MKRREFVQKQASGVFTFIRQITLPNMTGFATTRIAGPYIT